MLEKLAIRITGSQPITEALFIVNPLVDEYVKNTDASADVQVEGDVINIKVSHHTGINEKTSTGFHPLHAAIHNSLFDTEFRAVAVLFDSQVLDDLQNIAQEAGIGIDSWLASDLANSATKKIVVANLRKKI